MSKIYQLTKDIHSLIPQINQKYGLEIKLKSKDRWALPIRNPDNELEFTEPIYPEQIRQILFSLKGVLPKGKKTKLAYEYCEHWLDGLAPLIDREPETVLEELSKLLENLLS